MAYTVDTTRDGKTLLEAVGFISQRAAHREYVRMVTFVRDNIFSGTVTVSLTKRGEILDSTIFMEPLDTLHGAARLEKVLKKT